MDQQQDLAIISYQIGNNLITIVGKIIHQEWDMIVVARFNYMGIETWHLLRTNIKSMY